MQARFAIAALTCVFGACDSCPPITLEIIRPADADPFSGPDAATQARIALEGDPTPPVVVGIDAGALSYDISPANPTLASRLRVDALNAGVVRATGATPPTLWSGICGVTVSVLVQAPDSIVPAPENFATGRSNAVLLPATIDGAPIVCAATLPAMETGTGTLPDCYDTLTNGRSDPSLVQLVPSWCDGDCSVVPLSMVESDGTSPVSGWLLTRGTGATCTMAMNGTLSVFYDGVDVSTPGVVPPSPSLCPVFHPTVVPDLASGGWLIGGHDSEGNAQQNVDYVTPASDAGVGVLWTTTNTLSVPRDAPQVIPLAPQTMTSTPEWLIVGGQDPMSPLVELYQWQSPIGTRPLPLPELDGETAPAAACVAFDATTGNCNYVMLVGGRVATSSAPSLSDAIIDVTCALANTPAGCSPVAVAGNWLAHPRWGATAVLAEGGTLLVVGGSDATGPVFDAEAIDVSHVGPPVAPPPQGTIVGSLPCANPSVIALSDGRVMIAGGTDSSGNACTQIAFYRGPNSG